MAHNCPISEDEGHTWHISGLHRGGGAAQPRRTRSTGFPGHPRPSLCWLARGFHGFTANRENREHASRWISRTRVGQPGCTLHFSFSTWSKNVPRLYFVQKSAEGSVQAVIHEGCRSWSWMFSCVPPPPIDFKINCTYISSDRLEFELPAWK